MQGLTRRQALATTAVAAGAAALGRPHAAAARGDHAHDHGGGDGHAPRRTAPPLTLTGANLLDPATGQVTEGATVVFEQGVVRRAGRRERPASGGRVIDVGGAFVLPGLIDAHVHAATVAAARLALSRGATTVRSASTAFFQDVGLQALAEYGGLGVPRVLPAGLFVTPNLGDSVLADPALAPLAALPDGVRSPEAMAFLTRVNIARGAEVIKTRSTERAGLPEQDPRVQVYDERQIRAVVDAARRLPGGVLCHGHGDEGIRDSVRAGVRSVEHGTFASAATLDEMRARRTFLTPTISAVIDLAEPGGEYTDPRLVDRGREMLVALKATLLAAFERGIPIAAGTDTAYTPASLSSVVTEIKLLGQLGLPKLDALRAATTVNAALLAREREIGRLRPGYAADAVVVGANPLDDLAALDDIRLIVASGWIAREGATTPTAAAPPDPEGD
jgi:imidazolonepropionase-like amidohydrolase